jgi:hypothetical protein
MSATIIAAIIGAGATITAAIIGRKTGYQQGKHVGFEEGRKHSLLRYMDEHERQLHEAVKAIERGDQKELRGIAQGIVDVTVIWRKVQENFKAMLNGRIDGLARALEALAKSGQDPNVRKGMMDEIEYGIKALQSGFRAKRLAVETELEKSKI